jgi:hypothetical protein
LLPPATVWKACLKRKIFQAACVLLLRSKISPIATKGNPVQ